MTRLAKSRPEPLVYNTLMLEKYRLTKLYVQKKLSVSVMAGQLKCSEHKVNYWLTKHGIEKRSISDAIYQMHHPRGDPFFPTSSHSALWNLVRNVARIVLGRRFKKRKRRRETL